MDRKSESHYSQLEWENIEKKRINIFIMLVQKRRRKCQSGGRRGLEEYQITGRAGGG